MQIVSLRSGECSVSVRTVWRIKKRKPTGLAGGELDLGREQAALLLRFFQAMQLAKPPLKRL
jgi:hypothetical protein